MIEQIERLVEAACAAETNSFGYGIWTHHITHVVRTAKHLAGLCQADPEIVEIAALLHDYASIKDPALYQDHHLHGPIEAERILQQLGYPPAKTEAVKHCIASHRGSVPSQRNTPEANCLANADAITHLEQVPSLLYYAFVHRKMDIDEGTQWVRAKLTRSWHKLSPQFQELMSPHYEAVLHLLPETLKFPEDDL